MIQIRWECLSFCVGYVPRGRGDDALPLGLLLKIDNIYIHTYVYMYVCMNVCIFVLFKSCKICLSALLGQKEHALTWLDWQWINDMLLNSGWWMKVCHILDFHKWNIQNGSKLDRKCWSYIGHESLRYSVWVIDFGHEKTQRNKSKTQIKNIFTNWENKVLSWLIKQRHVCRFNRVKM